MVNFHLQRFQFTEYSTIGELFMDSKFICFILEDKDRGLDSSWHIDRIRREKIAGRTAIPSGRYKIDWTFSNKYQKHMPILLNVKGYEGIRIHSGNTPEDTMGCLIPGLKMTDDNVMESRKACVKLYNIIHTNITEKKEIFIEITRK